MKLAHSLIETRLPRFPGKNTVFGVPSPFYSYGYSFYGQKDQKLLYDMNLVLRAHVDSSVISVLFTDWLTVVSVRAGAAPQLARLKPLASLIST